MQHRILLAFRKRLKNRGYTNISICRSKTIQDNYIVTAREPLANVKVSIEYSLSTFSHLMR